METKAEMNRRVRGYFWEGLVRQALDRVFDADEVDVMVEAMWRGLPRQRKTAAQRRWEAQNRPIGSEAGAFTGSPDE